MIAMTFQASIYPEKRYICSYPQMSKAKEIQ